MRQSQATVILSGNVMCSRRMLGRHLQSYFKRRLEQTEDRAVQERVPESLVCKYCILFRGYSVAKSKKDVLPGNKGAYLHLMKFRPKQSVQIKIEMFHPMTGVLLVFACFVPFLHDLSQLPGWCYWLVAGIHQRTDEMLYLKRLETNLPPPLQKKNGSFIFIQAQREKGLDNNDHFSLFGCASPTMDQKRGK